MSVMTYQCEEEKVLCVTGELDANSVADAQSVFESLALARFCVIVDLSELSFIDSSGIGALVFLYKRLIKKGKAMVIVGVKGQPKNLFDMLRISQNIRVYDNLNKYLCTS